MPFEYNPFTRKLDYYTSSSGSVAGHDRLHSIDSVLDHVGVVAAVQDNFVSFDVNGLPQDSGYTDSDFEAYVKHNLTGSGIPTVTDDTTKGYAAKSLWFDLNVSPDEIYRCVDATISGAVWLNTSLELGDLGSIVTQDSDNVGITGGSISSIDDPVNENGVGDRGFNDIRYYQQSEVDTISGSLSSEIDSDISTHASSADHDGRYYTETELDNGQLDNRYYTETEVDGIITTVSGDIVNQIPTNFDDQYYTETELDNGQLDNRYYTEAEVDTISGSLSIKYETTYIDASSFIPCTTNGALAGTYEYGTNDINIDYFAFDGGATEERIQFKTIMPEGWDRGVIKAKFLWTSDTGSTTGDTVEWAIKAGVLSDGDVIDTALGTAQVISDILLADDGTNLQLSTATPTITVSGIPTLSDMVVFEVYRNTDGTDDLAEDAWLNGVWVQYRVNNSVSVW